MANQVAQFTVTVAPGSTPAAPVRTSLSVPPNVAPTAVRVRVPPGPRGQVGWRLTTGGVPVFPSNGAWVVADDEVIEWPLDGVMDSGAWEVSAYNTGSFSHSILVTFLLPAPVTAAAVTAPQSLVGAAVS